jgi:hypothetical protein
MRCSNGRGQIPQAESHSWGRASSPPARRGLLGVWSEQDQEFRYPDFQFDARGQLRPELATLLAYLPDGGIAEAGDGRCGCIHLTRGWTDEHMLRCSLVTLNESCTWSDRSSRDLGMRTG